MNIWPIVITEILTDAYCPIEEVHHWRSDFTQFHGLNHALYHNHDLQTGKSINQYPLIQYRSYENKAGIFALQDGAKILDRDISGGRSEFKSRGSLKEIEITKIMYPAELSVREKQYDYEIEHYAPFHSDAYNAWKLMGLAAQVLDLEKRIRGSLLLQLCGALQWRIDQILHIEIRSKGSSYILERNDKEGLFYMAHKLIFRTNILLPTRIAIGNNVAYGYGVIYPLE